MTMMICYRFNLLLFDFVSSYLVCNTDSWCKYNTIYVSVKTGSEINLEKEEE